MTPGTIEIYYRLFCEKIKIKDIFSKSAIVNDIQYFEIFVNIFIHYYYFYILLAFTREFVHTELKIHIYRRLVEIS